MLDLDKMAHDLVKALVTQTAKPQKGGLEELALAALVKAHRAGWDKGVIDFAIWNDGEQLVGCMQRPLGEVLRSGPS